MNWKRGKYVVMIAIIALCLYPAYLVYWASSFADEHGCKLHEGFVNPCVVNAHDYGEQLYNSFASGWFMIITVPVATVTLLVLLKSSLLSIFRALRRH